MKVFLDKDRCDGYAYCVALAPEVYAPPEEPDFRTELLMTEIPEDDEDLEGRVIAAIHKCPKLALSADVDVSF